MLLQASARHTVQTSLILRSLDFIFKIVFVCFVALRPKSIAMVMAGRSVHLTSLFLGKLEQAVYQYFVHILSLVTDKFQDRTFLQNSV